MKNRTLHITNNYPTANNPIFGIFVKEQIESLKELGLHGDVFFINGRELGKIEYLKSILRLRKTLKINKYDIIHCHHSFSALVLLFSFITKKSKWIVSFQNDVKYEIPFFLFKFISAKFDLLIFKNRSEYTSLNKAAYLPNGVNMDFFKPIQMEYAKKALSLDLNKKYILFTSSNYVRQQKRYDRFKAVIELIKETEPELNVEELVLTNVKRDLIPLYFNASHIHLLCSDFEGSPNSVKEAMSCNTPVVSTNVGNVQEMLENVENCVVVDNFCENKLAEKIRIILKKNQKSNGRIHLISKKLDKTSVANELLKYYNKLYE